MPQQLGQNYRRRSKEHIKGLLLLAWPLVPKGLPQHLMSDAVRSAKRNIFFEFDFSRVFIHRPQIGKVPGCFSKIKLRCALLDGIVHTHKPSSRKLHLPQCNREQESLKKGKLLKKRPDQEAKARPVSSSFAWLLACVRVCSVSEYFICGRPGLG